MFFIGNEEICENVKNFFIEKSKIYIFFKDSKISTRSLLTEEIDNIIPVPIYKNFGSKIYNYEGVNFYGKYEPKEEIDQHLIEGETIVKDCSSNNCSLYLKKDGNIMIYSKKQCIVNIII